MTNERSIESVILHAKGLVTEAEEDDGWVMIAAGLLSMLLGEFERLRAAHEPAAGWNAVSSGPVHPDVAAAWPGADQPFVPAWESEPAVEPEARPTDDANLEFGYPCAKCGERFREADFRRRHESFCRVEVNREGKHAP